MIKIEGLYKNYNKQKALDNLSLHIKQGEFYGLLGPNGAGKSTTISILSGILKPTEGKIFLDGHCIDENMNKLKMILGVVTQEIALYNEFTALENVYFWGSLYNIPNKLLKQRSKEVLNLFGLLERQNDKIKTFSGGMKRRVNIATALIHNPKILLLDEPTVGIDPQSRNLIFEVLEKLNKEGTTVVYTSHNMEEIEKLCSRIGIIDNGNIIAQGDIAELREFSKVESTIILNCDTYLSDNQKDFFAGINGISFSNNKIILSTKKINQDLYLLVSKCIEANIDIAGIDISKANLEHIFLTLTGKQLRDQ